MNRKRIIVVASLVFLIPLAVRGAEHESDKSDKAEKTPRANAEKKKPTTLAEKISACLAERPKDSTQQPHAAKPAEETGTPAKVEPQQNASTKANGAALVQKFCVECHNPSSIDPRVAANYVHISKMPPPDAQAHPTAEERQALIDYFSGAK